MDFVKLFYWLTVADNARFLFKAFAALTSMVVVIVVLSYLLTLDSVESNEEKEKFYLILGKWFRWSVPFAVISWLLLILTPNKKDTLFIVGGGGTLNYLTKHPEAKKIPDKLISLINVELDRMASEESINLNLNKETTNQIDSIRNLPPEELLKKLDQDYYFRKFYYENLNK
jgi:hypothetical protein